MNINKETKLNDLLVEYPFLEDFFIGLKAEFKMLRNKAFRLTMSKIATLEKVADIGGINIDELIIKINERIEKGSSTEKMTTPGTIEDEKINILKEIIKKLHKDENFTEAKKQFDELIKNIEPGGIVKMEEALIGEGMPISEVQRLCSVHHSLVSDGISPMPEIVTPAGHPVNTYKAENEEISRLAGEMSALAFKLDKIEDGKDRDHLFEQLVKILENLMKVELHYRRKENQLFPFLERKGFSGPSQVMWAVHDEIRAKLKKLHSFLINKNMEKTKTIASSVSRDIIEMVAKENSILFPMAMERLTEDEWIEIRRGEDAIGYSFGQPSDEWLSGKGAFSSSHKEEKSYHSKHLDGEMDLNTGVLTLEQLDCILTTLPIDLSFVDENDNVKYYTEGKERIFPRSPGVIGRNVEKCHPPKSVHIVRRILDEFKAGKKDSAEFWIQMGGKFIQIRYLPVRNKEGKYLGTLEFTQDISSIKNLEGERRLLNWEGESKT
jgi:DUF438 domain-containing protein